MSVMNVPAKTMLNSASVLSSERVHNIKWELVNTLSCSFKTFHNKSSIKACVTKHNRISNDLFEERE